MDAQTNPSIGHFAQVTIKKSPNEKTNTKVSYPIRYGRSGGNSIWIEKEIVDLLYAWEFVKKSGSWYNTTEEFKDLLSENKLEFPEKLQGESNVFKTIEDNPRLSKFLVSYFKNAIGELT